MVTKQTTRSVKNVTGKGCIAWDNRAGGSVLPPSQTSRPNSIEALVRAATLRRTLTLSVQQAALAATLIFGGSILMLLLGTQILDWYWLVLLGGSGAAVAFFRVWRSRLEPYRVAQLLDQKFQFSDSLSTAWFLRSSPAQSENSVAQFQIARAEELAQSIRPRDAFPLRRQRSWAIAAALAAVAVSLFAVRYLVTNSLSLRQSLIPIQLDSVFERSPDTRTVAGRRALDPSLNDQTGKMFSPQSQETSPRGDVSQPRDGKQSSAEGASSSTSPGQSTDPQRDKKAAEDNQTREGGQSGKEAKAGGKGDESSGQQPNAQQKSASKGESPQGQDSSPGLMEKMKDALSGMLAKMRPNPGPQRTQQDSKRQNGDAKNGDPASASKDKAGQQQNAGNQQPSQDQNATGQAQGETKERAQASQGQSSDSSPQSGSDAKSGVGSQDGDKGVKEANQLQAMGKLEEIIGKRSANLTGEMSVESPSNKQQLKTAYSQRQGHHSDLGGEINRDEVPLMYRPYVREYMEQVRKQGNGGQ